MKHLFKILLFSQVLFFSGSCADNLLAEFADENDDDAIIEQAKIYISDGNYTKAIQMCGNLSSSGLASAEARYVCASAYAGNCGLSAISFMLDVATIAASTAAGSQVIQDMVGFAGTATAAQAASCDTAEDHLQAIGAAADRTDRENFLMVLIGLKKIQAYIESQGDLNSNGIITDDGIDSCSSADYLDDTEVGQIGSALWEVKESASYSSDTNIQNLGTLISTLCGTLPGANDFCAAADADTFDANQLVGVRAVISEDGGGAAFGTTDCGSAIGGGTCCGL